MSTIKITPTKADGGTVLTCHAGLPNIPRESLISASPTVQLNLGPANQLSSIKEGEDVTLDCDIEANPPPHMVTWKKNVSDCAQCPNLSVKVILRLCNLFLFFLIHKQILKLHN